jgi:hypothetical protein
MKNSVSLIHKALSFNDYKRYYDLSFIENYEKGIEKQLFKKFGCYKDIIKELSFLFCYDFNYEQLFLLFNRNIDVRFKKTIKQIYLFNVLNKIKDIILIDDYFIKRDD